MKTNIEINKKKINSYLGQKGYTIIKNELTIEEQKQIRNDLTIKPHVHGAPAGLTGQNSFPAYRESSNKIYVPHYYGVEHFGKPSKYKISEGLNIQLPFQGTLRDTQIEVVKTYVNHVLKNNIGGGLLELPCAAGKCLQINTPIIMYDGSIKLVQDIKVGDILMGDDSTPRNVLSIARGKEIMYKVIPDKGEGYVVNESHILSLKCVKDYKTCDNNNFKKGEIIDISVLDYLKLPQSFHNKGVLRGYRLPIHFEEKPLPIDPYLIGNWLGDEWFDHKPELNTTYNNSYFNNLKELNIIKNRHIPLLYKCNSRENRLKLLAGIIDTTGHITKNGEFVITQKSEIMMNDIIYLVRSLGFACYKKVKKSSSIYKGVKKYRTIFKTTIYGNNNNNNNNNNNELDEIPTLVVRPIPIVRPIGQTEDVLNYKIKLEKLEVDDYYGFEIDGNRRFVLGDFTVTHNTVLSLNIISQLKKKTFIIVHKEFLMNQWIERINQFLPNARIGKIQGQIIDIDNKDIVIGMLQSLSMKEYPPSIFDSFGLTIIDEVHHISSEVFSNTLFKLVTKYMLGLSATMERKDGTTKVFKMFLGDVIFKGKRDEEHAVIVRAIEYKVNDDEFNEVKLDYRGNPAYSSMISKLCEYNRRSEFILKVMTDMFIENPSQQIMVLAHNKNLLKYLYEAILHRNIATVGYYVGGMKEHALKETEGKQVVIATYAMAAEALDIKTLTTLIMATPKTDIEQSVGRILRVKHSQPLVVDIMDSHDLFKNQWRKRKTFYKRENYKIIYTTSVNYTTDISKWDVLFEPKKSAKVCVKKPVNTANKNTTAKSHSSTDKSIANETDSENDNEDEEEDEEEEDEEEEDEKQYKTEKNDKMDIDIDIDIKKDKLLCGKCLLTFKPVKKS